MNISEFIFRSLGPLLLIAALTCWHPLNDALLDAQRVTKQTLLQENSVYNQGADDSSVTADSFVIATAAEVRAALLTPSDKQIIVDLSDYERTVIVAKRTVTNKWRIVTKIGINDTTQTSTRIYEDDEYPDEVNLIGDNSKFKISIQDDILTYKRVE